MTPAHPAHFASHGDANAPGLAASALAARQDGVVSRGQLRSLGLSDQQVNRWLRGGRLHSVHRGVFAVGHPALTENGKNRAALLAAGGDAALFRESAAHHLALIDRQPPTVQLVTTGRKVRITGLEVARRANLDAQRDITVIAGLRCTTVARTLIDLASVLAFTALEQAAANAEYRRILDLGALAATLDRAGPCTGADAVRRLLLESRPKAQTRFERRVLNGLLAAGIPEPVLQERFTLADGTRIRPDYYWPDARVVGEADGPHHARPLHRAKDARRDAGLGELGIRVFRITYAEWQTDRGAITSRLARILDS